MAARELVVTLVGGVFLIIVLVLFMKTPTQPLHSVAPTCDCQCSCPGTTSTAYCPPCPETSPGPTSTPLFRPQTTYNCKAMVADTVKTNLKAIQTVMTTTEPRFGMVLDATSRDVGGWVRDNGFWEGQVTVIFQYILHEACRTKGRAILAVDVGANVGWFSLLAASWGCHVISFEPSPLVSVPFECSIAINGFEEFIDFYKLGIGDTNANLTLNVDTQNSGQTYLEGGFHIDPNQPTLMKVTVPVVVLNDYISQVRDDRVSLFP